MPRPDMVYGSPGPATRRWLRDDAMSRLRRSRWLGAYRFPPIHDHGRSARFWTSDLTAEEAFAAAFGEPIETWTMPWAQDRLGVQKATPSTNGLSVLLTLVTLLACVGIATATTARSRVKNPYFGPAAFT